MNGRDHRVVSRFAMRQSRLLPFFFVVFGGALAAWAVCWPLTSVGARGLPVWWLQLAAHALLCLVCLRARTAVGAWTAGWLFSLSWLSVTFSWLFVAMHTYGGLAAPLAAVGVVALAGALSLYYAGCCYFFWRWAPRASGFAPVLFAALWTMAELARATWLTGFGWGAMAYAHTEGPLRVLAPLGGVYGVGAVAAWLAAGFARAWWLRRWRVALVPTLALIMLSQVPALQFTVPAGRMPVVLLQGNIPQDQKFESGTGIPQALAWYADQLQAPDQALFVAPETALPVLLSDLPPGYWAALRDRFQQGGAALLIGMPAGDDVSGYHNALVGMGAATGGGPVYEYDKHHLVPFGEFIPPMFKWFTRLMHIPLGDFAQGGLGQPSFVWGGQRLAPNICYEDLYGEELGVRFRDPALAPTILVNVSNLGWFGDTLAIDQHLQISRMRSLEFQRSFLRATNTGSTAILDADARTQQALPYLARGALRGVVEGRSGRTPYAVWVSRLGLWPVWCLALFIAGVGWVLQRERHRH